MADRNVVLLQGELNEVYDEKRAKADGIIPGMLIAVDVDEELIPHGTAGGVAENLVALECDFLGRTMDDQYLEGEIVHHHLCQPGDRVNLLLAAAAVAVTTNDFLTSAGDGTVKKATGSDVRLYKCIEAIDNSAGATKVRVAGRAL